MSEAQSIIDELNASYLYGVSAKSDALAQRIIAILTPMATPASPPPPAEGKIPVREIVAWLRGQRQSVPAHGWELADGLQYAIEHGEIPALRTPATSQSEERAAIRADYTALVTFGGEIGTAHISAEMSARILAALGKSEA